MKTSTSNIPASNALTNEELKAFFNKLIDARPRVAARLRENLLSANGGITPEEAWQLRKVGKEAYVKILLNPPAQSSGASEMSDVS